jgi:hypothetical protein
MKGQKQRSHPGETWERPDNFFIARNRRRGNRPAMRGPAGPKPLPYLGGNFAPKRAKE